MKPILFNTEMVRAILDGRKTVTRRLAKPKGRMRMSVQPFHTGEILYIRETWTQECGEYYYRADFESDYLDPCETLSGGYPYECTYHPDCEGCGRGPQRIGWRPSIHMPKDAARIFLRVKDVRAERLQDITKSEKEIEKEGVYRLVDGIDAGRYTYEKDPEIGHVWSDMVGCFKYGLWNSTIKKEDRDTYGWDANPVVWVIEFEKIKREETEQ